MTLFERQRAVGMLKAGMSLTDVALHFNRHNSTIHRLRHRLQATGSVKDRPRSSRPQKTTPRQDRFIVTSSRRNRRYLSRKLMRFHRNVTGTRVSDQTIRNRLRSARLKACQPYVGIPMTLHHRQERRQWALAHCR